jgi:hypothetical protein
MGRFLRLSNGVQRSFDESSSTTIYDQVVSVGSTINAGTNITLPASQTYNSSELEIVFNGQFLIPGTDYNYIGTVPRTQISFNMSLISGDVIRYLILRNF